VAVARCQAARQKFVCSGELADGPNSAVFRPWLLGEGGGRIRGPTQEVMKDVPLENVVARIETIVQERAKAI
jgi:hypothetical protein